MRSYINESEFFDIHRYLYSVCERTLISPQALKDKSPLPPEFISTLKELYLHFSSSDEYSDPQPSRLNIRLLLTKDKDISLCDRKSALSQLFISSENEIISPLRTKKELELALSICQLTPRAAMLYAQNEKLKSLISEHLVESM